MKLSIDEHIRLVKMAVNNAAGDKKARERLEELADLLAELKDRREKEKWIPVKWHNITEEEREGYPKEWLTLMDCLMPDDDQEILITTKHVSKRTGKTTYYVEKDQCYIDEGFSLDSGYDWIDDVVAWRPLPEPYKD